MEWTRLLTQLPFYANVGSVLGFLITVWAFTAQMRTRRRYLLLLRGPKLRSKLDEYGSVINRYEELAEDERKTVLAECRSTLKSLSKHVDWSTWMGIARLRWTLWGKWNRASPGEADDIHARIRGTIIEVDNLIQKQKAEQV